MRFWSGRLFPFRIVVACCVCIVWTVDPSSKPVLHSKKCNADVRVHGTPSCPDVRIYAAAAAPI